MLTKFVLDIDDSSYELRDVDLKNWDQIECSYSREDYGGVMRSFMSKFEFVNDAYSLLSDLFDRDGFQAKATVYLYVMNDNWENQMEFSCILDFSTLTYNEEVLSINAIDSSYASLIKANKSTKYEYLVNGDIVKEAFPYLFDRLKVEESATYEITEGESQEDGSLIGTYDPRNDHRIYIGTVGSEVLVNGLVYFKDDQEYVDGYLLESTDDVEITLDYSVNVNKEYGCSPLVLMRDESVIQVLHKGANPHERWTNAEYLSIDEVRNLIKEDTDLRWSWANENWDGRWVVANGVVWEARRDALGSNDWVCTNMTTFDYVSVQEGGKVRFTIGKGQRVWIKYASEKFGEFGVLSSNFRFSWIARGNPVQIDCISPAEIATRLLTSMGVYAEPTISQYDPRIKNTLILAAESIRGLEGAKITTSFNDFCNWMETVFGYVYVIDEEGGFIHFKHREEIFKGTTNPFEITNAVDVEYSIENSILFSSVTAGYSKQDYEGVNGRDEFNFNSTYTNAFPFEGKKLTLNSPYRADSYGIEFLAEKRGQDTTDNPSDTGVFFVLGERQGEYYRTVRKETISNSLTGTLINGEFSPMKCIESNIGYISMSSLDVVLKFASTEGNSDIRIGNLKMNEDLTFSRSIFADYGMLTPGVLKFSTDCQQVPENIDTLIKVVTERFVYYGFIKDVCINYGRPEIAQFTLLVQRKEKI